MVGIIIPHLSPFNTCFIGIPFVIPDEKSKVYVKPNEITFGFRLLIDL